MTLALAIFGAALSFLLALLQVYQAFFRRARLGASMRWISTTDGHILHVVIFNYGSRKATIGRVRFRFEGKAETCWAMPASLMRVLPIALDIDEAARPFLLGTGPLVVSVSGDPNEVGSLEAAIQAGRTNRMEIETVGGRVHSVQIPPLGTSGRSVNGAVDHIRYWFTRGWAALHSALTGASRLRS